mgnify:CR=1 FL=1
MPAVATVTAVSKQNAGLARTLQFTYMLIIDCKAGSSFGFFT